MSASWSLAERHGFCSKQCILQRTGGTDIRLGRARTDRNSGTRAHHFEATAGTKFADPNEIVHPLRKSNRKIDAGPIVNLLAYCRHRKVANCDLVTTGA